MFVSWKKGLNREPNTKDPIIMCGEGTQSAAMVQTGDVIIHYICAMNFYMSFPGHTTGVGEHKPTEGVIRVAA